MGKVESLVKDGIGLLFVDGEYEKFNLINDVPLMLKRGDIKRENRQNAAVIFNEALKIHYNLLP